MTSKTIILCLILANLVTLFCLVHLSKKTERTAIALEQLTNLINPKINSRIVQLQDYPQNTTKNVHDDAAAAAAVGDVRKATSQKTVIKKKIDLESIKKLAITERWLIIENELRNPSNYDSDGKPNDAAYLATLNKAMNELKQKNK